LRNRVGRDRGDAWEAEEEAVEEVLWHLARPLDGRSEVHLREGMRAAHSRLGPIGNVHLSPEAEAYFAKKGCKVLLQPTPEAIGVFNRSHAKKIGLFHVTC
jgi:hypothetical protein